MSKRYCGDGVGTRGRCLRSDYGEGTWFLVKEGGAVMAGITARGWLLVLAVAVFLSGCFGSSSRREEKTYPVQGTVLLDDKPLPEGEIYFKNPATGSVHIAQIRDGKFQGQASAGDKRVEILAYKIEYDPVAKEMYGDQAEPTKINIIPPQYNVNSTLTAKVTAADSPDQNTFEFKVTSK